MKYKSIFGDESHDTLQEKEKETKITLLEYKKINVVVSEEKLMGHG